MSDIVEQLASAPVQGTHKILLELAIHEIQSLRNAIRTNVKNDFCDICSRPQWVMPNGEHRCKSIEELQEQYEKDTELLHFWQNFADDLQKRNDELLRDLNILRETTDTRNRS